MMNWILLYRILLGGPLMKGPVHRGPVPDCSPFVDAARTIVCVAMKIANRREDKR